MSNNSRTYLQHLLNQQREIEWTISTCREILKTAKVEPKSIFRSQGETIVVFDCSGEDRRPKMNRILASFKPDPCWYVEGNSAGFHSEINPKFKDMAKTQMTWADGKTITSMKEHGMQIAEHNRLCGYWQRKTGAWIRLSYPAWLSTSTAVAPSINFYTTWNDQIVRISMQIRLEDLNIDSLPALQSVEYHGGSGAAYADTEARREAFIYLLNLS